MDERSSSSNQDSINYRQLDEIASWIGDYLRTWGRVPVQQTKEKYGEVRVYCTLYGWHSLHDVVYPGYVFVRSRWMTRVRLDWVPVSGYHQYLYRRAYRLALLHWPEMAGPILSGADYPELLGDL